MSDSHVSSGVRYATTDPDPDAYDVRPADRDDEAMADTLANTVRRLCESWHGQETGESLQAYGGRVLCFLIATGVTSVLSDLDLTLADRAAIVAQCAPDVADRARQHITDARHIIASIQRGRGTGTGVPVLVPVSHDLGSDGGRLSPIEPQPFSRPPAGQKVGIVF